MRRGGARSSSGLVASCRLLAGSNPPDPGARVLGARAGVAAVGCCLAKGRLVLAAVLAFRLQASVLDLTAAALARVDVAIARFVADSLLSVAVRGACDR